VTTLSAKTNITLLDADEGTLIFQHYVKHLTNTETKDVAYQLHGNFYFWGVSTDGWTRNKIIRAQAGVTKPDGSRDYLVVEMKYGGKTANDV